MQAFSDTAKSQAAAKKVAKGELGRQEAFQCLIRLPTQLWGVPVCATGCVLVSLCLEKPRGCQQQGSVPDILQAQFDDDDIMLIRHTYRRAG